MKEINKVFTLLAALSAMAVMAFSKDAGGRGTPPDRPEPTTLTGVVQKGEGDALATFAADDGKVYTIAVMKAPGGNGGRHPAEPPAGMDAADRPEPPKVASEADVQAFIGKRAAVTGFIPGTQRPDGAKKDSPKLPAKENEFVVISIEEK